MPHHRAAIARSLVAFACALTATAAFASAQRTFVSPAGNDANTASNCGLTSPCRTFSAAISVTNSGGEIIVLDSAGYGAVAITKSVSIIAPPGIYAGVSVFAGDGFTINSPGVAVTLKGLAINGQGPGTVGIHFTQGSRLDVDGCTVSNMSAADQVTGHGIFVDGAGTISIANSTISGNAANGIRVNGAATVAILESTVESNGNTGISIEGGALATIEHTTVVKNSLNGIAAVGSAAGTRVAVFASVVSDHASGAGLRAEALTVSDVARLDVADSTVARNGAGVSVVTAAGGSAKAGIINNQIVENSVAGLLASGTSSSIIRASWNGIFRNGAGFSSAGGGLVYSPTTNYVRDNGTDGAPTADTLL
jgi:hypothetical protein